MNDQFTNYIKQIVQKIDTMKLKCRKGELGCLLSHLCVLITISKNEEYLDDDFICIFEEDFVRLLFIL